MRAEVHRGAGSKEIRFRWFSLSCPHGTLGIVRRGKLLWERGRHFSGDIAGPSPRSHCASLRASCFLPSLIQKPGDSAPLVDRNVLCAPGRAARRPTSRRQVAGTPGCHPRKTWPWARWVISQEVGGEAVLVRQGCDDPGPPQPQGPGSGRCLVCPGLFLERFPLWLISFTPAKVS